MTIRAVRQGVFFAAAFAALGFGARSAMAAPAAPEAPRCDAVKCNAECSAQGTIGFCSLGHCWCAPIVPAT